jgi:hypothetical protein
MFPDCSHVLRWQNLIADGLAASASAVLVQLNRGHLVMLLRLAGFEPVTSTV